MWKMTSMAMLAFKRAEGMKMNISPDKTPKQGKVNGFCRPSCVAAVHWGTLEGPEFWFKVVLLESFWYEFIYFAKLYTQLLTCLIIIYTRCPRISPQNIFITGKTRTIYLAKRGTGVSFQLMFSKFHSYLILNRPPPNDQKYLFIPSPSPSFPLHNSFKSVFSYFLAQSKEIEQPSPPLIDVF